MHDLSPKLQSVQTHEKKSRQRTAETADVMAHPWYVYKSIELKNSFIAFEGRSASHKQDTGNSDDSRRTFPIFPLDISRHLIRRPHPTATRVLHTAARKKKKTRKAVVASPHTLRHVAPPAAPPKGWQTHLAFWTPYLRGLGGQHLALIHD